MMRRKVAILFVCVMFAMCSANSMLSGVNVRLYTTNVEFRKSSVFTTAPPFLQIITNTVKIENNSDCVNDDTVICQTPTYMEASVDILILNVDKSIGKIKHISSINPIELITTKDEVKFVNTAIIPFIYVSTSEGNYVGLLKNLYYNEPIRFCPKSTFTTHCADIGCNLDTPIFGCKQYVMLEAHMAIDEDDDDDNDHHASNVINILASIVLCAILYEAYYLYENVVLTVTCRWRSTVVYGDRFS